MKPTFNQICAITLCIICVVALMIIYFNPKSGENSTVIVASITSAFSMSVMYLVKSASDAKNEKQEERMVDALKNSTPTSNQ